MVRVEGASLSTGYRTELRRKTLFAHEHRTKRRITQHQTTRH